jgi:glycosyltransferase involved in cell wall biosynthesis
MSCELSVVIPVFNEEDNIPLIYKKLVDVLSPITPDFELIFVNDGSSDKSLVSMKTLTENDNRVYYLSFSRNFGHQNALKAGLDHANGEAVISMDADLQHPPELIPDMLALWKEGYDVVYTIRQNINRISWFKKTTSTLFYKIVNVLSETKLEEGTADFRLLDQKVVTVLRTFNERNLFFRGVIPTLGFQQIGITYLPRDRFSGKSKYSFSKMLKFALTGITSSSTKPLYFSIYVGLIFALTAFIYALYAIYIALFTTEAVTGWTSIIASILFIGGVQLIMIGIIGIYLGKLFSESKNRPVYIIEEKN